MTAARAAMAGTLRFRSAGALHQFMRTAAVLGVLAFPFSLRADPAGDGNAYRLGPGDRITVSVFGQAELSGDIAVDGTGKILLPLVGPIDVRDLTIDECQNLIRDRLADGVLRQPSVSVRISELRPLYVLGDVRAPGAYPFRYGSTVQSAVAVAGGFGLPPQIEAAAVPEFLLANERVRQLSFQRQVLLVRRARLEAQRDGAKSFSPPASEVFAEAEPMPGEQLARRASSIIADEMDTFAVQADILQRQLELLRSQRPRLENEIESYNGQIEAAKKQLDAVKQHADQYSRLVKQGLGVTNAELQFRLTEANQESELWRLNTQVMRLRMEAGELDVKIYEAEAAFKRQVVTDLRDVRERLRELDVTLPSAREIREAKRQQAGSLFGAEADRTITVTRARNGQTTVFEATEATVVQPGDIIDVKKRLPPEMNRKLSASESGREAAARELPVVSALR
ncbi:polysaccharide biosynthesis/export family protein [Bradyrhizobium sp. WSM 1704]|uniref:polysaccharide biosynthesis/export family protein n=1 Tax=Bradyrhizobium semiaridum TaxID=2821404 RepID=UPI001CE3150D|nr:polysaccharide biosynthesis/export family protein [Bradyrhizobium semiaridum]MCA6122020.1 polysaccharide biosynthesis/export family protein [Bradyrhizobium semiaridum]